MDAGSTFLWDCTATGQPAPVLTWSKDGTEVFQRERFRVLANNSLVIRDVKPEDAGQYQCHASNGVSAHVVQATLTVRGENIFCSINFFLIIVFYVKLLRIMIFN